MPVPCDGGNWAVFVAIAIHSPALVARSGGYQEAGGALL